LLRGKPNQKFSGVDYVVCVVVCDLETSTIGAPYIYDISNLRVNKTDSNIWSGNMDDDEEGRTSSAYF